MTEARPQRPRLEAALDAALEAASPRRERAEAVPALSHELRTPLNSMLVLARLLADNPEGNLTAQQVEYARVIHSAGTDLLGVISDLFGPAARPAAPPDAPAAGRRLLVVEAARGGMLTLLARGAVSGPGSGDTGSGDTVPGPGSGGARGPVEVLTAATADEAADVLAAGPPHCVVLDLGADGELASAALEQLRSRPGGQRVPVLAHARDDLAAARFGGLLGRSSELLRSPGELRERIAWHLSADRDVPAPGRDVPAPGRGAVQGPGAAPGRGHRTLRGKKILVVDDDPRNVFAITSTLEHHGMTVLRSADGQDGIDRLRSEPDTDLVLMDLMMPGMDGYAAISAIRGMPEFTALPIIAVTARTMTGDPARAVPGADDCLIKPLDTDELLGRMARCLA